MGGETVIRVASVTTKVPRLIHLPRRGPQAAVPSKRRNPAERAAALQRSEAQYRRLRDDAEASFLMSGGRYL